MILLSYIKLSYCLLELSIVLVFLKTKLNFNYVVVLIFFYPQFVEANNII